MSESPDSRNATPGPEYGSEEMQSEATRLMTAAKGGDRRAFDDLFVRLRGRAFHVARALVGSREDAQDLTQEAFLKAYRARDSYDPSQPFLPWFQRILRNTCFSFLRKRGRLRSRSLTAQDGEGEEVDLEIVDPGPAPEAGALAGERERAFDAALGRLSARDREIIVLRHHRELSYKEIAATLEIPEGTVMSRLFHARRRLREALGSEILDTVAGEATSAATPPASR